MLKIMGILSLLAICLSASADDVSKDILVCKLTFTDTFRVTRYQNGEPRYTSHVLLGSREEVKEQAAELRKKHDAVLQKEVKKQKKSGFDDGFRSDLNCGSVELSEKVDF